MRTLFLSMFICLLGYALAAQDFKPSGQKYEQTYQPLNEGTVLTDTSNFWIGFSEFYSPEVPASFFEGSVVFEELDLEEIGVFLYNQNIEFVILGLYVGSEVFDIWRVAARVPEDSSAALGRITVAETDSSFVIEFRNVAYELLNWETDSTFFIDAQFTYQVHLDYRNDKIRYHFGETLLGPLAQAQMEDLSILSGCLMGYESSGGGASFPYIFASGEPEAPRFIVGEGDFTEIPPYEINSFPEEGTVYEFKLHVITSTADPVSGKEFTLFPNPGSDQLVIEYPGLEFDYEIRNATGQLMDAGTGSRRTQVMAGDWPAGMYFVSVGEEHKSINKVWIKSE